jgi:hypothetical protein
MYSINFDQIETKTDRNDNFKKMTIFVNKPISTRLNF